MGLELIIDVNDQEQNGLLSDLQAATPVRLNEFFNSDDNMDIVLQPVRRQDSGNPFVTDWLADDEYEIKIGNPDDRATGGTFTAQFVGFASSGATVYNATAAQMKTAIDATSTDAGFGTVTVTLLQTGVYLVDWDSNGAVTAIPFDATLLEPSCTITVTRTRNGSVSTKAQQLVEIKQSPVAEVTLSTASSEVVMTASLLYTPSSTQDAVWNVFLSDYIYGQYALPITANGVTSTVILDVSMDEQQIGTALATHPEIYFQDTENADNIAIKKESNSYTVTFIGTLGGESTVRSISSNTLANPTVVTTTTAHGYVSGDTVVISGSNSTPTINGSRVVTVISPTTFSVPVNVTTAGTAGSVYNTSQPFIDTPEDVSLVYPVKLEGTLDLATVAMAKQFAATTEDSLDFTFQVKRTRDAGGEVKVIFSNPVTIKRAL